MKPLDIVRLGNGDDLVITQVKPNRPANPFCGVLVNGKGTEYKFGLKHRPTVIGVAESNHPALLAHQNKRRLLSTTISFDDGRKAVFGQLLDAIEAGDLPKAQILAAVARNLI